MRFVAKKVWVFACISILLWGTMPCQAAEQSHRLKDPVRKKKVEFVRSSLEDGYVDSVTWDCIWYGSFPQKLVDETDGVYSQLQACTTWDQNNDAMIEGQKYRKYTGKFGKTGYFQYLPIKWRVLQVKGTQVTLISDLVLEYQPFSDAKKVVKGDSWKTSTVRSYLNGYSAASNAYQKAYNNNGSFICQAFSKQERSAILKTTVYNNDMAYHTNIGKATSDKIFLPAEADVCQTQYATGYGFPCEYLKIDASRTAEGSDYLTSLAYQQSRKADSVHETFAWGLRTNSSQAAKISYVTSDGIVGMFSYGDNDNDFMPCSMNSMIGIRPMMNLDLSLIEHCYYAGTVSVYPQKEKEVALSEHITAVGNDKNKPKKPKSGITKGYVPFVANGKQYTVDGITYEGYIYAGYYEWDPVPPSINTMYLLRVARIPDRKTVTIPTYVKIGNTKCVVARINKKAAYKNKKLQRIIMGDSIKYIDEYAFAGCSALQRIEVNGKKRLPQYIESIKKNTFLNCRSLKQLEISENVGYVDKTAFKGCHKLKLFKRKK